MNALFESVAWNSLAAIVLAVLVLVAGRVWKRPELLHVLWLVVLVKLVSPGVVQYHALPDVIGITPEPQTQTSHAVPTFVDAPTAVAAAAPLVDRFRWVDAPAAIWIAGSAMFLVLVVFRCVRFARAMRTASPAPRALARRIQILAGRIGVSVPRIRVLEATVPPMVWSGLGRSTLVLPSRLLDRLTAEETDTLLTHELAHVKRRDPWVRWIELVVTATLWWNPLVWWIRRRLRQAEEQACDRRVLEVFPAAKRVYAEGIVKTVEFLAGHPRPPHFATGAVGTRHIKERLTMILNPSSNRRLRHPLVPALLLALLALPIVPGFAERDDRVDDQARAELLALQQEALELEQRLHQIAVEQEEIRMRLGETHSRAASVEARRQIETLIREGRREEAAEVEAKLAEMERRRARERVHKTEILDRERAMRDAELEMREAKIAYERARGEDDLSAAEHYERALAEYKRQHADESAALQDAQRMYERAHIAQQQARITDKLDAMAREYEQLRESGRDAEADKLAMRMERLHAEMSERDDHWERDAARHAAAGEKVRAQLDEMRILLEQAEDGENRDDLRRKIEILTKKLHELERGQEQSGVR